MNLWKRISVELAIKNRIVGGIPTNPKLIEGWIAANMPEKTLYERQKLAAKTLEELPKAVDEAAEGMWTTFKKVDGAIYIEGRNVKAMFKESANVLRELLIKDEKSGKKTSNNGDDEEKTSKKSRYTALKAKLAERLFIEQEHIFLQRHGKNIEAPDGTEERAIHVMTAMGPRTALKRFDFVNAPAKLKFTLRFLMDGVVDLDLIKTILSYASWNGMGADRSQGNGLFEVVEIQSLD